jgi:hypothetical protein
MNWRKMFLDRFAGREDLGKEDLYARFFAPEGLPKSDVFECLELIEFEYEFSPGLLRPDDGLTKLFDRVVTRNPWRWMLYQVREGDSKSEINYQLANRMRRFGTLGSWSRIETVNDLLRAWCGQTPNVNVRESG